MIYELSEDVMQDKVNQIHLCQFQKKQITAITGAGISVRSGLPLGTDSMNGLPLSVFFQSVVWESRREEGFQVYRTMLHRWRHATPNQAHRSLAEAGVRIITQNIDGLHRDAGSREVIELHGNLRELLCKYCLSTFSSLLALRHTLPQCPTCGRGLYPAVTLEGEPVRHIARAVEWVAGSSCIVVIGTQLEMDPVRQLFEVARSRGLVVVWITAKAEVWLPLLFADFLEPGSI